MWYCGETGKAAFLSHGGGLTVCPYVSLRLPPPPHTHTHTHNTFFFIRASDHLDLISTRSPQMRVKKSGRFQYRVTVDSLRRAASRKRSSYGTPRRWSAVRSARASGIPLASKACAFRRTISRSRAWATTPTSLFGTYFHRKIGEGKGVTLQTGLLDGL